MRPKNGHMTSEEIERLQEVRKNKPKKCTECLHYRTKAGCRGCVANR